MKQYKELSSYYIMDNQQIKKMLERNTDETTLRMSSICKNDFITIIAYKEINTKFGRSHLLLTKDHELMWSNSRFSKWLDTLEIEDYKIKNTNIYYDKNIYFYIIGGKRVQANGIAYNELTFSFNKSIDDEADEYSDLS